MKRSFLVIGMSLVLLLSLAAVASAFLQLAPPPGVGEFCTSIGNGGPFSHDTCVVCANKGNNGQVCFCKILEDLGTLTTSGFTSFGNCVETFLKM